MGIVTGRIKEIKQTSFGVHNTNELTIKSVQGGYVFIDFRGDMKRVSDHFEIGQCVIVEYAYDGKTSKSRGKSFNNLPATSIQRV